MLRMVETLIRAAVGLVLVAVCRAGLAPRLYRLGLVPRRFRTSLHEAGHAIASWYDPFVTEMLVAAVTDNGGNVRYSGIDGGSPLRMWNVLVAKLAGIAAEAEAFSRFRSGPSSEDLRMAAEIARRLAQHSDGRHPWASLRETIVDFTKVYADGQDAEVIRILAIAYRRARTLLAERRQEFLTVARALYVRGELDNAAMAALIGPRTWALIDPSSPLLTDSER